jgi:hypothetical protein
MDPFHSFRYQELKESNTLTERMLKCKITKHLLVQPVATVSGHVRGKS